MTEPNENKTGESSFSSKDLSTELEQQVEVTKLSSDLLRDFYQTFRLSQGVTNIQESLFELLAREHLQSQHTGMLVDALEQAEERVAGLMPPVRHIETDQDTRNDPKTGFDAMWNQYKDLLQNPKVESEHPVENVLDIIIEKEISYQKTVRPNRTWAGARG